MVGDCEYDRPFICGKTDGVTESSRRAELQRSFSSRSRYYGNTPGRPRPRAHLASMPPAITLAPVQPTYGAGRLGAALFHIAKCRSLRCPGQGRLGDRSVSAIQHYTSEAASLQSTPTRHVAHDPNRTVPKERNQCRLSVTRRL